MAIRLTYERVLTRAAAAELADRLDFGSLPACPLCLFDLAWAMHSREPARTVSGALTPTTNWVWDEIEDALRLDLARADAAGVRHAAEALEDLDARGRRSPLVRVVVARLAQRLVDEIRARDAAERRAAFRVMGGGGAAA